MDTKHEKNRNHIFKIASIVGLFLSFILIIFLYQFGVTPSDNIQTWNNTASIINSLVSPSIAAISLILLYNIWIDNREELQKTKEALSEQSALHKYNIIENTILKLTNQFNDEIDKVDNVQCTLNKQGGVLIKRKYTALKAGEVPLQSLRTVVDDYFRVLGNRSELKEEILIGYNDALVKSEQFEMLTSLPLCISKLTKDIKIKKLKNILHQVLFSMIGRELLLVIAKRAFHQYEITNDYKKNEKEKFKVMFLEFIEILDRNCDVNDLHVFNLDELCLYTDYKYKNSN